MPQTIHLFAATLLRLTASPFLQDTPPALFDFSNLLNLIVAQWGKPLGGLLLLVLVDVLLGVGSALRRKQFQWQVVANFYRTTVLPKIVGWVAAVILSYAVILSALPNDLGATLAPISATLALAFVVADLGSSIIANWREVFGPAPVVPPVA